MMRSFLSLLIVACVLMGQTIVGNDKQDDRNEIQYKKSQILSYYSNLLSEERRLTVSLPGDYHRSTKQYPMLFILDAEDQSRIEQIVKLSNGFRYKIGLEDLLDVHALIQFGYIFLENGKSEDALACFQLASTVYTRCPMAFVGIGDVYRQSGKWKQARYYLKKALAMDPQNRYLRDILQEIKKKKDRAYGDRIWRCSGPISAV